MLFGPPCIFLSTEWVSLQCSVVPGVPLIVTIIHRSLVTMTSWAGLTNLSYSSIVHAVSQTFTVRGLIGRTSRHKQLNIDA